MMPGSPMLQLPRRRRMASTALRNWVAQASATDAGSVKFDMICTARAAVRPSAIARQSARFCAAVSGLRSRSRWMVRHPGGSPSLARSKSRVPFPAARPCHPQNAGEDSRVGPTPPGTLMKSGAMHARATQTWRVVYLRDGPPGPRLPAKDTSKAVARGLAA
jgi:hypothetical protein